MRIAEMLWNDDGDEEQNIRAIELYYSKKGVQYTDWKAYVDEVLEKVDEQLAAFGLEVVEYEHGGDYYQWHIEQRVPGSDAWLKSHREEQKRATAIVMKFLRKTKEERDAGRWRGKEHLEPWRERRRKQFAARKTERCSKEEGTTRIGVPLTKLH